jgi:hypothetical protein
MGKGVRVTTFKGRPYSPSRSGSLQGPMAASENRRQIHRRKPCSRHADFPGWELGADDRVRRGADAAPTGVRGHRAPIGVDGPRLPPRIMSYSGGGGTGEGTGTPFASGSTLYRIARAPPTTTRTRPTTKPLNA